MRRRLCLRAALAAFAVCWSLPACFAQEPEVAAPDLPTSLLVKDQFARALKNQSSAPYYLMVTIVNDTTGESKRVCIEGTSLFEAVQIEKNKKNGKADVALVTRSILDNPSRLYHFKNAEAWQKAQPRYSPHMLTQVQERSQKYSTAQLAAFFSSDRKNEPVLSDKADASPAEASDFSEAIAYVLTDRGLLARREDFSGSLHVTTPAMLTKADRDEAQRYAEDRKLEAEGRRFAATLPGYTNVTRHFDIVDPRVAESVGMRSDEDRYCLSADLQAKQPGTISRFDWKNPVTKETGKARYDWNRFLSLATHAERLAERFPWLAAWRKAGTNRTIEAQMYGRNLHGEYERTVRRDISPAWQDAGLGGKPYCELRLRWEEDGEDANATVYLPLPDSGETRCLIVGSSLPYHATKSGGAGAHWLDGLSLRSSPTAQPRQCVVVTPGGQWSLLTLPTRAVPKKAKP